MMVVMMMVMVMAVIMMVNGESKSTVIKEGNGC